MIKLSVTPYYKSPHLQSTIDSLLEIKGYIYLITNIINGKQYVGQTISSVKQRWSQHIYNAGNGKNYPLYNAINKYGNTQFKITILAEVYSIQELNKLEIFFIKRIGTVVPRGYNLRSGGGNGGHLHETTRKKLSIARKGKKGTPHTEKFKKQVGVRSLGNKYALGRKQSKEEKRKHKVISSRYKRGKSGKFIKNHE